MKKRKKKAGRSNFGTFTKKWVSQLMYVAMFDIQLSYLLAFLGKEQIAETLSITVVTEIIGVMAVYFVKSFLETKEQEKIRIQEREMDSCIEAAESEEEE
ncbi:MAG: hypothetical protein ACI4D2_03685 [Lachnospiraceae bacterium]